MLYYPRVGAAPAPNSFPLIGFAHGYRDSEEVGFLCEDRPADRGADASDIGQDYRQWSHVLRAIASWGFVVVSPDLHWVRTEDGAEPRDSDMWTVMGASVDQVRADFPESVGRDPAQTAYLGHSTGGFLISKHLQSLLDPQPFGGLRGYEGGPLGSAVALIAPRMPETSAQDVLRNHPGLVHGVPLLMMTGIADSEAVPPVAQPDALFGIDELRAFRDAVPSPSHFVGIIGADHWGYTDSICETGTKNYIPSNVLLGQAGTAASQSVQRELADRFLAAFFRKYLLAGGERVPDDLFAARAAKVAAGLRGVRVNAEL
jgi:hypothetical protein